MSYREKKKRNKPIACSCCGSTAPFFWRCRNCGFALCQDCMYENFWSLSCNGIMWNCPECQAQNGLGNQ